MAMSPEEKRLKQREWSQAWRERNPEKYRTAAREAMRKKRAENPMMNAEACRRYQERHQPKILAGRRERWASDLELRERSNDQRLEHYYAHHEDQNAKRAENALKARVHTPWLHLLKAAGQRAAKKGLPFTLTAEWAASRWTGRCEVTDIEFRLNGRGPGPKFFSPSLDQIAAKGGYTPDNCRFVLWAVNSFKHDATDDDMILVAHAIVRNFPSIPGS